jgi:hypothetical protein
LFENLDGASHEKMNYFEGEEEREEGREIKRK